MKTIKVIFILSLLVGLQTHGQNLKKIKWLEGIWRGTGMQGQGDFVRNYKPYYPAGVYLEYKADSSKLNVSCGGKYSFNLKQMSLGEDFEIIPSGDQIRLFHAEDIHAEDRNLYIIHLEYDQILVLVAYSRLDGRFSCTGMLKKNR